MKQWGNYYCLLIISGGCGMDARLPYDTRFEVYKCVDENTVVYSKDIDLCLAVCNHNNVKPCFPIIIACQCL